MSSHSLDPSFLFSSLSLFFHFGDTGNDCRIIFVGFILYSFLANKKCGIYNLEKKIKKQAC